MAVPHYPNPHHPPFGSGRWTAKKHRSTSAPLYVTRGALARAMATLCLHLCIGGVDPRPFLKMAQFRAGDDVASAKNAVPGTAPTAVQEEAECKRPLPRKDSPPEHKEPINPSVRAETPPPPHPSSPPPQSPPKQPPQPSSQQNSSSAVAPPAAQHPSSPALTDPSLTWSLKECHCKCDDKEKCGHQCCTQWWSSYSECFDDSRARSYASVVGSASVGVHPAMKRKDRPPTPPPRSSSRSPQPQPSPSKRRCVRRSVTPPPPSAAPVTRSAAPTSDAAAPSAPNAASTASAAIGLIGPAAISPSVLRSMKEFASEERELAVDREFNRRLDFLEDIKRSKNALDAAGSVHFDCGEYGVYWIALMKDERSRTLLKSLKPQWLWYTRSGGASSVVKALSVLGVAIAKNKVTETDYLRVNAKANHENELKGCMESLSRFALMDRNEFRSSFIKSYKNEATDWMFKKRGGNEYDNLLSGRRGGDDWDDGYV